MCLLITIPSFNLHLSHQMTVPHNNLVISCIKCKCCGKEISHGGDSTKTHNTTNLVSHLKRKHHDLYLQYKQNTNDPRAQVIHQIIGEMIALDIQPLCVIEDRGFTSWLTHLSQGTYYQADDTLLRQFCHRFTKALSSR